ncbi:cytidylate kinase [Intrasporangium chromatireducens Q5-1]|uniref:Cytidylate kinase n=1 Tax=Intrasporangium chromatireducens Q5-1 TaxID=584657 RepID=W9GPI5_9MICO|nr:(d)CMP kinase [Intrasporangium chromatireducens]EWT06738.1 cytidylate kinase [Intrasporangium chromatireducens Q5-1]
MPAAADTPLAGFVIAIDGPSGSGKSSVSKQVARTLGFAFLDTGAMYRSATWWCLDQGIDLDDAEAVTAATAQLPLTIGTDPDLPEVHVHGVDVSAAIRQTRISEQVSKVATIIPVREILRQLQRRLISEAGAAKGGVVAEGRDITTVVAPDAQVRILLTASEEARLARRSTELHGRADAASVAATRTQIVDRDRADSSVSEFTVAADGVTTVDTSDLDFGQSVAAVLQVVDAARQ